MLGEWFVTAPRAKSRFFKSTKDMVEFLKKHPGSIVSWIPAH